MKPIGQTFFVNEPLPPAGGPGIFVTRIDVYFQTVSSVYGIEMQIRTTENGYPTSNRLPFASKILLPSDTIDGKPAIVSSADASKPTSFIFDTPIFLQSNKSYAFVLAPLGGNPEYNVWTAQIGQKDATTGAQIFTNNDSGDLFLSSNDIDWTPIINEDMKYTIYCANFTSTSGTAYFHTPDEEWVVFKDNTADFQIREPLVFGNGYFNYSLLSVAATSGTISVGDTVYQNTGSANVSGIVYFANSSVVKISNATGVFSITSAGSPLLYDATSNANTTVTAVSQNVATSLNSNTISVPDSTMFATNQVLYIQTNNRSTTQVVKVTAKPTTTSIQVNSAMLFTETNALYGRVKADGALTAGFSGSLIYENIHYGVLDASTANAAVNFANMSNVQIIGLSSGTSANLVSINDPIYNSLTTNFSSMTLANTLMNWSFSGFKNDTLRTPDSGFSTIQNGFPNEFNDIERVSMSRSNELSKLPVGRAGNNSVVIKTDFATNSTKVSPFIDTMQTNITYTYNIIPSANKLSGYYFSISNTNGSFSVGDVVTQNTYGNNTTGIIYSANDTSIYVSGVNGKFISNTGFLSTSGNGFINSAEKYNEANNNGYHRASRYISKTVNLAIGQDSEDLQVYLGGYRPATTDLLVYAKVKNSADSDLFNTKDWTKLENVNPNLQSSPVNINDLVELIYKLPSSQNIFLSNTRTDSTNNIVYVQSSGNIVNNSFIYLTSYDSTVAAANSGFNVREVVYVINSTALMLDRPPSFTQPNSALGIIPGIESPESAFLYDYNNYIARYATSSDAVYDSFLQFAIKIVPVAQTTALVPRASDLRVLALQV